MTKIACLAGAAVAALLAASAAAQTSEEATRAYLDQIGAKNDTLHAVIAVNPAALADARARDLLILPVCPFFSAYLQKHPEYADVVHPTYRG